MENERSTVGWNIVEQNTGEYGKENVNDVKKNFPVLGKWEVEFGFGEIWSRPQLDMKQRELITLAALTVLGDSRRALDHHIRGALKVGLTPAEISEVLLHCVGYIGFPRAMNALYIMKDVFDELGIELPKE
ncbi:carboxymuconolactone decarboxylase family protein [Tumebacillus flagellatus]|uniref:Carboxymuconolactone decarboxylase-like domain-containing protein n=1 Tax=Tumebacillus flagellatus TaxID=1157490 RepID=A0A074M8N0_9BACL|nr:carboxymuconolactone decarboxylase family protein [Tumebacillus flagellatus]KEO82342.1 hypothetical protein EL26_15565 [Tumebacillus flagellatus]